jgi:hypothetical protein
MLTHWPKYLITFLLLFLATSSGFAQETGKTNAPQQDKTLIKKQSAEISDDRAAFIQQYNGNVSNNGFIYSREQGSSGASLLRNGDYEKYDLSKIRQINLQNNRDDITQSKQYSSIEDNNRNNQSRNNSEYLYIEQFGRDNVANLQVKEKSNSTAGQYGDQNQAEVKARNGEQNQSRILQTEDKNRVKIDQQNTGHNAIINQYKGDNKARISQKGSQNWVDVDQSEGSELDIKQSGSRNIVRGTRSSWAESLNGSILEVEQYGSNNRVDLQQNGSRVELKQKGINNKTTIIQQ